MKKVLNRKAKLWIYQLIYVPTFICSEELWVMTERIEIMVTSRKMSFLCEVAGLQHAEGQGEELRVEPLLPHMERRQLRASWCLEEVTRAREVWSAEVAGPETRLWIQRMDGWLFNVIYCFYYSRGD